MFKLTVRKDLTLTNPRLRFAYCILFVATSIYVILSASITLDFTSKVPIQVDTILRPDLRSIAAMTNAFSRDAQCSNTTCASSCSQDATLEELVRCKAPLEIIHQSGPKDLFLETSFTHLANGSEIHEKRGAAHFALKVSYSSRRADSPGSVLHEFPRRAPQGLTVVLDAQGKPMSVYKEGDDVRIPFSDIVAITEGMPGNIRSADDLLSHASQYGALISTSVDCYGRIMDAQRFSASTGNLWDGIVVKEDDFGKGSQVCLLRMTWISVPVGELGLKAMVLGRSGLVRGIHFFAEPGSGYWRSFDLTSLVRFFTSSIVLLSIPKQIVREFAVTCLGHLSAIYRSGLQETFSVRDSCGSAATRFMTHIASYRALTDRLRSDFSGIPRAQMRKNLSLMLAGMGEHIDESELDVMTNFCFHAAQSPPSQSSGIRREMKEALKRVSTRSSNGNDKARDYEAIEIGDYMRAASSNEYMNVHNMVQLFDKDRPVPLLERLFTPVALYKAIHKVRHQSQSRRRSDIESSPGKSDSESSPEAPDRQDDSVASPCMQDGLNGAVEPRVQDLRQTIEELGAELRSQIANLEQQLQTTMALAGVGASEVNHANQAVAKSVEAATGKPPDAMPMGFFESDIPAERASPESNVVREKPTQPSRSAETQGENDTNPGGLSQACSVGATIQTISQRKKESTQSAALQDSTDMNLDSPSQGYRVSASVQPTSHSGQEPVRSAAIQDSTYRDFDSQTAASTLLPYLQPFGSPKADASNEAENETQILAHQLKATFVPSQSPSHCRSTRSSRT